MKQMLLLLIAILVFNINISHASGPICSTAFEIRNHSSYEKSLRYYTKCLEEGLGCDTQRAQVYANRGYTNTLLFNFDAASQDLSTAEKLNHSNPNIKSFKKMLDTIIKIKSGGKELVCDKTQQFRYKQEYTLSWEGISLGDSASKILDFISTHSNWEPEINYADDVITNDRFIKSIEVNLIDKKTKKTLQNFIYVTFLAKSFGNIASAINFHYDNNFTPFKKSQVLNELKEKYNTFTERDGIYCWAFEPNGKRFDINKLSSNEFKKVFIPKTNLLDYSHGLLTIRAGSDASLNVNTFDVLLKSSEPAILSEKFSDTICHDKSN